MPTPGRTGFTSDENNIHVKAINPSLQNTRNITKDMLFSSFSIEKTIYLHLSRTCGLFLSKEAVLNFDCKRKIKITKQEYINNGMQIKADSMYKPTNSSIKTASESSSDFMEMNNKHLFISGCLCRLYSIRFAKRSKNVITNTAQRYKCTRIY